MLGTCSTAELYPWPSSYLFRNNSTGDSSPPCFFIFMDEGVYSILGDEGCTLVGRPGVPSASKSDLLSTVVRHFLFLPRGRQKYSGTVVMGHWSEFSSVLGESQMYFKVNVNDGRF